MHFSCSAAMQNGFALFAAFKLPQFTRLNLTITAHLLFTRCKLLFKVYRHIFLSVQLFGIYSFPEPCCTIIDVVISSLLQTVACCDGQRKITFTRICFYYFKGSADGCL